MAFLRLFTVTYLLENLKFFPVTYATSTTTTTTTEAAAVARFYAELSLFKELIKLQSPQGKAKRVRGQIRSTKKVFATDSAAESQTFLPSPFVLTAL